MFLSAVTEFQDLFQPFLSTIAPVLSSPALRDEGGSATVEAFFLLPPGKSEDGSKCGTEPIPWNAGSHITPSA
jgi:hypothetical protein